MRKITARKYSKRVRLLFWVQMLLIPFLIIGAGRQYGSMAAGNHSDSGSTAFVVIVSGSTYDAIRIDPATVALEGQRLMSQHGSAVRPILRDVNGDSRQDLLVPIAKERLPNNSSPAGMQLTAVTYEGLGLDATWFLMEVENSTGAVKSMVAGRSQNGGITPEPCVMGPFQRTIFADTPTFGRLIRNGIASSCASSKACPGTEFPGVFTAFDGFRKNNTGAPICVTVTTTALSCASGVHTTALVGNIVRFGDLCQGYAGDSGQSTGNNGSTTFSFNVPAGELYSLIFFEETPGALCSSFIYSIARTPCFVGCLQDDSNGNILRFDPDTGTYEFMSCGTGFIISGRGQVTFKGNVVTLQDNSADRRVLARVDNAVNKGSASVQLFSSGATLTITDRNTLTNTCACPEGNK
jgi:hypothetical protein